MTPQDIYDAAVKAATNAQVEACLVHDQDGGMCGATWMVIRPARGSFVKFLKDHRMGNPGTYGGYELGCPVRTPSQNVDIKMAVTKAFADSLRSNGVMAAAYERLT